MSTVLGLSTSSAVSANCLVDKTLERSRVRVSRTFPSESTHLSSRLCGSSLSLRSATPPMAAVSSHAGEWNNGPIATDESSPNRIGEIRRITKETNVHVKINLDGSGIATCSTGIPFLDHMLDQLASHGLFDVYVKASGDTHIDDHHTNEDVALAIGSALLQALGDRKGINRFGHFAAPLDEAAIEVILDDFGEFGAENIVGNDCFVVYYIDYQNIAHYHLQLPRAIEDHGLVSYRDLSGRPHLNYDLNILTERVGTYDTQLVEHFFQSLVNTSGMTLHIRQLAGKNSHHIIEATFKAFARALRQATEYDLRRRGTVPSSKGVLSRS